MKKTFGQILWEAYIKANEGNGCSYLNWNQQDNETKCSLEAAAIAVLAEPLVTLKQLLDATTAVDFQALYDARANARELLELMSLPEHIDPYAAFEKARAEGKVIQLWFGENHWVDVLEQSIRHSPADRLRVKPWTLSNYIPGFRPLEDGEEWHAQNQWVEEFLPAGYRPLLNGELWIAGDEMKTGNKWRVAGKCSLDILDTPATDVTSNCRTRRPLPSTKQELEREEFEGWWGQEPSASTQDLAWAAWQAARNSKHARTS